MNIVLNKSCRMCGEVQPHGVMEFPNDTVTGDGTICGPCITALFDYIGLPPEARAAILEGWFAQLVADGHGDLFDASPDGDDVPTVPETPTADSESASDGDRSSEAVGVPGVRDSDSPDVPGTDVADREGA